MTSRIETRLSSPSWGLRQLRDNDTMSLRPGARGLELRGLSGTILVTQERDPFDHVLGPGDVFRTAGRGLVVVWALSDGAIAVDAAQARGRESELPASQQRDAA